MNRILLFLFLPLVICCSEEEKKSPTVFFAGEIVNPTSEYVVLYKDDVIIDSAKLDTDNRFAFTLNSINEGLHHFSHSPELQYIYLEHNDSIQIRLNTIDFDESLVFSGTNGDINNFLINMFLTNEDEQYLIKNSYCRLEPEAFDAKLDSLKELKINELKDLQTEITLSKGALEMANASIDYNYFIYKELYPFYHKRRNGENTLHPVSKDFYSYRKDIDYEGKNLTYLRPYYNFMLWHFENLSFMECKEYCSTHDKKVKNKLHFNTHKLRIIDSLAKGKELRDNLFRNVAVDYLLKVHDKQENNEAFISEFHKFSKNNKHIAEIDSLYIGIKNIQPANKIPNLMVVDVDGNTKSLQEISKGKKVVFYFWSATNKRHFNNVVARVANLTETYPDHTFVGINLRTDDLRWKTMIGSHKLNPETQFRATDYRDLEQTLMVFNDRNKSVIAEDGIIVDAFANLYKSF
ncbi:TlpA family protein disulfide reductase [Costertonia aggregata]|uniref:Redoxin domain-containing protein n=1 Tax=Costertonia aggregata TaxID=343403 RepID=A0A7H9AJF4_9FLAO|nr:redoxin domain-containing protein [Costertonia aggregata]QLG43812.1 redoxin domain-containing protein [Costertonia aggregata]